MTYLILLLLPIIIAVAIFYIVIKYFSTLLQTMKNIECELADLNTYIRNHIK